MRLTNSSARINTPNNDYRLLATFARGCLTFLHFKVKVIGLKREKKTHKQIKPKPNPTVSSSNKARYGFLICSIGRSDQNIGLSHALCTLETFSSNIYRNQTIDRHFALRARLHLLFFAVINHAEIVASFVRKSESSFVVVVVVDLFCHEIIGMFIFKTKFFFRSKNDYVHICCCSIGI